MRVSGEVDPMFRSFRIGSLFGIPLKLDVTFLLILPIFAWVIAVQIEDLVGLLNLSLGLTMDPEPLVTGWNPWILGAVAAIGLFTSVVLHELGHSLTAIRFGFPIHSITLWLLGGVAQLEEQPTDWREELIIAIAGPIVSVALGVGFWLAVYVIPAAMEGLLFLVSYLAVMNIILAAFNMLPGFPMDGGRVLRALLARNQPFAVATAQAAQVGKLFAIGLGFLGLIALNFIMIALALFIYIAAAGEARYTALQSAVEGIKVEDIMTPVRNLEVVRPEMSVDDLLERMFEQRHTGYPVVDADHVVGVVALDDVRGVPSEDRYRIRVADIMTRDLATISPHGDAIDAIEELQRRNIGRLVVLDDRGQLVGLVTRTDIVRALSIGALRSPGGEPSIGAGSVDAVGSTSGRPRW